MANANANANANIQANGNYELTAGEKLQLLYRLLSWGATRYVIKPDLSYSFKISSSSSSSSCESSCESKFMGVREAVAAFIRDNDVVATSGLGGNQPLPVFVNAIRERFEKMATPRNLTLVTVGGMGGRGKAPGTLEDLGVEGLITRIFTGHAETFKSFLKLADENKLEFQIIPQGTLCLLLREQAVNGKNSIVSETGRGTFLDISQGGRGTPLRPVNAPQYVEVLEDGKSFKYSLPFINVAIYTAPAADKKGNIYLNDAAIIGESWEIAKAAKRNGGRVLVMVGKIVEEGYGPIHLTANEVDAIIYHPGTEQTCAAWHSDPWKILTTANIGVTGKDGIQTPIDSDGNVTVVGGLPRDPKTLSVPTSQGIEYLRFINTVLKITPQRTEADRALGRLAAQIFVENAHVGMSCDIGVGLPEVTSALLFEGGVMDQLVMINESGVFGGIAAPGVFFGAAVNPTEMISSGLTFERIYKNLDSVILGALEVDNLGNVNVSKRGVKALDYVGPGGFIDLVTNAKLIVFCCNFITAPCQFEVTKDGKMKVVGHGKAKFMERVHEITFNGQEALKKGKRVFYITHVGCFQLTKEGVTLIRAMPGIDIQKDIINRSTMRIIVPKSVAIADSSVVTGKNFKLQLKPKPKL